MQCKSFSHFVNKKYWARLLETDMSLVNISLKFQTLISDICQYFWLKKCEKNAKASLVFSTQNFSVFEYKVVKRVDLLKGSLS